jgi:signal transduction histidine kinase
VGGVHRLWVKDNGVGFDSTKGDQVFAAFRRMHRGDQFEGNGVGLAIVQRIASKHNGTVKAESAPDQGATITIELPVEVNDAAPVAKAS